MMMKKTLLSLLLASSCALMACGEPTMTAAEQDALCDNYCELASANCQGSAKIFDSVLECFETCKTYNFNGTDGDTEGTTAQCRVYHIDVADTDPALHCPHASPAGGGVCDDDEEITECDSYCATMAEECDTQEVTRQYDNIGSCLNLCLNFRENGTIGDASGNTVQCRETRLEDANLSPVDRCNEAGLDSTVCVDVAPE